MPRNDPSDAETLIQFIHSKVDSLESLSDLRQFYVWLGDVIHAEDVLQASQR